MSQWALAIVSCALKTKDDFHKNTEERIEVLTISCEPSSNWFLMFFIVLYSIAFWESASLQASHLHIQLTVLFDCFGCLYRSSISLNSLFRLVKIRTCSRTASILHFICVFQADSPARHPPLCLPSFRLFMVHPHLEILLSLASTKTLIGTFVTHRAF
jgi:hypothetical protein